MRFDVPDAGCGTCPTGTSCVMGTCQAEACGAIPCPAGFVCVNGACVVVDAGIPDAGACASCPTPVNAAATCVNSTCGRGPCQPGTFDFEPQPFGCETSCTGTTCTASDGGTFVLTVPPVHERDSAREASSGGSVGVVQTNSTLTHQGTLGPSSQGQQSNSNLVNRGGFTTQLER